MSEICEDCGEEIDPVVESVYVFFQGNLPSAIDVDWYVNTFLEALSNLNPVTMKTVLSDIHERVTVAREAHERGEHTYEEEVN